MIKFDRSLPVFFHPSIELTLYYLGKKKKEYLSSSIPRLPSGPSLTHTPAVQTLHGLLEALSDLAERRAELGTAARSVHAKDDIRPRLIQEAEAIRRTNGENNGLAKGLEEVKVEWFEGLMERELGKYGPLGERVEGNEAEVEGLLGQLKVSLFFSFILFFLFLFFSCVIAR